MSASLLRAQAELLHQRIALRRIGEELLDLLAKRGIVAERALERRQRLAHLDELAELRHLHRDGLRPEVGELAELEADGQARALLAAHHLGYREGKLQVLLRE